MAGQLNDPQHREAILRSVLDHSSTVVFLKDLEGRYLLVNRRYEQLFGITNEAIQGKTDYDVFPKEAADLFREKDRAALDASGPIEEEERVPQEDGIHTYLSVKFPLFDTDGVAFATCGIATDITRRKAAEEALQGANEALERRVQEHTLALADERDFTELALNALPGLFYVFDEKGKFKRWNRRFGQVTGYSDEEIAARPATSYFDGPDLEEVVRAITETFEAGESFCEAQMNTRSGKRIPFLFSGMRAQIEDQHYVVGMGIDITERKRAQEQMYRADKMAALGQIIAGVAHEINNPNNFIYFNLPILRRYMDAIRPILEDRAAAEPDLKILNMDLEVFLADVFKLLENMEHGSQRITGIVSDLKDYIRSGEMEGRKIAPLGRVIDQVMTLIGKQVRKMVKRLDVEVADDLYPVEMNPGKIEQVIINLVINAGQAADKEDSWLRLSAANAAEDDGFVEIRVEDNGAGIPEANLERIFEPFFTSKSRETGTGLGLSISQQVIRDHGGVLGVESEEGIGTTFVVRLPAATDHRT